MCSETKHRKVASENPLPHFTSHLAWAFPFRFDHHFCTIPPPPALLSNAPRPSGEKLRVFPGAFLILLMKSSGLWQSAWEVGRARAGARNLEGKKGLEDSYT